MVNFSRKNNIVNYYYSLSDSSLQGKSRIRDLAIDFDSRLNFNAHVDKCVNNADKALGFII